MRWFFDISGVGPLSCQVALDQQKGGRMRIPRPPLGKIVGWLGQGLWLTFQGLIHVLGTMIDDFVHGSTNAKREQQKRYWRWRQEQKKRQA